MDVDAAFVATFLEIISRIVLGRKLDAAEAGAFTFAIKDSLDEGMRRIVLPPGGRLLTAALPTGVRYRRARRVMHELTDGCIAARLAEHAAAAAEGAAPPSADLLDLLLGAPASWLNV